MLNEADAYLRQLRASGDLDAGGLVVCSTCEQADATAILLTRYTSARPVVVCSSTNNPDDPNPAVGIAAFAASNAPWLVAVRMVSEGVDIRRLRVIVYATNVTAELSYRQIIGRVVRIDPTISEDDHGLIVLPADPRLLAMASRITGETPARLREPIEVRDLSEPYTPIDRQTHSSFKPLGSTGNLDLVFDNDGRAADATLLVAARKYIQLSGSPVNAFDIALAAAANPALRARLLAADVAEDSAT